MVSRSTDKVVTTFLLSSHQTIIQRESNCFSRWWGPYQETFNTTSRYLDDFLNIDNPYNEQMVSQIYPTELQLNKANSSDTEAPFLELNLSITNGLVSSKIYDKWDDFNFEIVNFLFLDGDVPRSPSYGVYISQYIRFARVCANVEHSTTEPLRFLHWNRLFY